MLFPLIPSSNDLAAYEREEARCNPDRETVILAASVAQFVTAAYIPALLLDFKQHEQQSSDPTVSISTILSHQLDHVRHQAKAYPVVPGSTGMKLVAAA